MSNNDEKKHDGEFDAKTFIYIRTNPADDGSEPLSAGLQHWLSPDITIIRPGGIRGSEGAVNELEQVEVTVTNGGGIDAVDAYVEAFVADPSTGFTPATAKPVGSGFLSISNHTQATISFPWTPTSTDAGHRCLLARVCLSFPPDCFTNPAVFDVVGDRHVAQRNINVAQIAGAQLSFGFIVVNTLGRDATFLLQAKEIRVGQKADMARKALGCMYAQFSATRLQRIGLELGEVILHTEREDMKQAFQTGVLRRRMQLGKRKSTQLKMQKGELRHAVLTIPHNPDIRRGDLNIVQVEQIDIETKKTVGGLWLIVQH
jgi:hypothetical protein